MLATSSSPAQHKATALYVMDVLMQAVSVKKRGAPASQGDWPKKGKGGKGKGKGNPKADSTDAVMACLVRDHIHMRDDVGNLKAATNLLIIVLDNDLKQEIDTSSKVWTDSKPEDNAPHPLACGSAR